MYNIYVLVVTSNNTIESKTLLTTVDCSNHDMIFTIVPSLFTFVNVKNATYKRIHSNKQCIVHVEPVKGIDVNRVSKFLVDTIAKDIDNYNASVANQNTIIKRANKVYSDCPKDKGIMPLLDVHAETVKGKSSITDIILDHDDTIIIR